MTNNVSITGIKAAGSTLKVKASDTAGVNDVSYVWLDVSTDSNNVTTTNVLGTNSSYKLLPADVSKNISVVASYKNTAGLQQSIMSDDILADLNQVHTGGISIKGATTVGSTLSIASTLKDKDGLGTFSYTWLVDNGDGNYNNDAIVGTSSTYTIKSTDVGNKIYATVDYTDNNGFDEDATSSSSAKVEYSTKKSVLNDHLTVNATNKVVTGGLGSDTFIFSAINTKSFKIGDFSSSQLDKLNLSAIDADLTQSGNQAFTFGAKPTGTPAAGALWFDTKTSMLYGSVDTDAQPEFSVLLTGVTSLTAADFVAL